MGDVKDIPVGGTPLRELSDRQLGIFRERLQKDASRLAYNAGVYANKRASKSWLSPKLSRLLQGTSFVPAHPTRYSAGGMTKNPQTFVVHRPGARGARRGLGGDLFDPSTALYIIREFSQENRKASTHFIVKRDGGIIQMVDLQDVAYHTGTRRSPNNWDSVGAELEGYIGEFPPAPQQQGLARLVRMLADAYGWGETVTRDRFVGHSEILARKNDPGPFPYEEVLARVNRHPRFSLNALFRPPFDLRTDLDKETADVLNAAASTALHEAREVYITAAGVMNARQRAAGLLFQTPTDLAAAAVAHTDRVWAGQDVFLSYMLSAEEIYQAAAPTPQTNTAGALFDFSTGTWNDTES